jgi:hypothetical protein
MTKPQFVVTCAGCLLSALLARALEFCMHDKGVYVTQCAANVASNSELVEMAKVRGGHSRSLCCFCFESRPFLGTVLVYFSGQQQRAGGGGQGEGRRRHLFCCICCECGRLLPGLCAVVVHLTSKIELMQHSTAQRSTSSFILLKTSVSQGVAQLTAMAVSPCAAAAGRLLCCGCLHAVVVNQQQCLISRRVFIAHIAAAARQSSR